MIFQHQRECGAIRVWRSLVSRLNGVQEAPSSNLGTRTTSEQSPLCSDVFFCLQQKKTSSARSLAPPLQIEPADAGLRFGFSFSTVSSPIITLRPKNDNPNYIIQVGNVFGFIISIKIFYKIKEANTLLNFMAFVLAPSKISSTKCLSDCSLCEYVHLLYLYLFLLDCHFDFVLQ